MGVLRKWLVLLLVSLLALAVAPAALADPVPPPPVLEGLAATCRRVPTIDPEACDAIDQPGVSEARMAAYEASWVHQALDLQRQLDDDVPLLQALVPHTHNSFNAPAYAPNVSSLDPNQLYTVRDQLRMDIRGIELDLHWAPHPAGAPADGFNAVVICHGEPVDVVGDDGTVVHFGCSVDRLLTEGLAELRAWLDEPVNADEVVLLYLENNLDGDERAHDLAAAAIEEELGSLVLQTPADEPCASMPLSMSRADIRAAGARVLIVGNCGPGGWGSFVHERGPLWDESGSDPGDDYPKYPACEAEREEIGYDTHWIRRYEDSTWLSALVGGGGQVTLTETRRMVRCGVHMPGFDQLHPEDPRLAELVWSWAPGEPVAGSGDCAFAGPEARFHAGDCRQRHPFACLDAAGAWHVTTRTGPWKAGRKACARSFPGSRFAVPANGYQNEQLREATPAGTTATWLFWSGNRAG